MRLIAWVLLLSVTQTAFGQVVTLSGEDMRAHSAFRVPSEAMEPSIHSGEVIYVDIRNFQPRLLKAGSIIAFKQPSSPPQLQVKRVVALAGSKVQFRRWKLLVDDKEISEPYVNPDIVMSTSSFEWGPTQVEQNCVFVLSDNRDRGNDSRTYGCVPVSDILGIAKYVAPASSPQAARRLQ